MHRKLKIDINIVNILLKEKFDKNANLISEFSGNENTRAFLFISENTEYVIKIDFSINDFKKDDYAYKHFFKKEIIIPETITLGMFRTGIYYSISKRLEGIGLDKINKKSLNEILPRLGVVLKEIHLSDISKTSGYGLWNLNGVARYQSWKDYLLHIKESGYFDWVNLSNEGLLDMRIFEKSYNKIVDLSKYVSEERSLLHGDYGFNNVLIKRKNVSGVLDWALSKYGDFVYDIALLAFWEDNIDYGKLFKDNYKYYKSLINYEERLTCYILHVGLSTLGFYAKWGNVNAYNTAKNRMLHFL